MRMQEIARRQRQSDGAPHENIIPLAKKICLQIAGGKKTLAVR